MHNGTENFARIRAMTTETAAQAVELGIGLVGEAKAEGYQIMGVGEVGICTAYCRLMMFWSPVRMSDSLGILVRTELRLAILN